MSLVENLFPALVDLGVNSDAMNNYINGPSWINTRLVPTNGFNKPYY